MFETLPVKRGRDADPPETFTGTSAMWSPLRNAAILGGFVFACLFQTPAAKAVLIAGPDGSINTTAPSPDPGFDNVGIVNGLTGVYVRNGWVLTANHVGIGDLILGGPGGTSYEAVPGSAVRFDTPGFDQDADLIAFLYREEYYLKDKTPEDKLGVAELIIGKHRNGPTGSVELMFFNSITRFQDMARDRDDYAP